MQEIVNQIYAYIQQVGGSSRDWYVGIASEPRSCLFVRHNVTETGGAWIYRDAGTDSSARAIERAFTDVGYSGGPGGGDSSTRYVYAYKITSSTRE